MVLGLTGSLGSGKSTVARMIEEAAGAPVIDADEITHRLQAPGGQAYLGILDVFGEQVLLPDGTLNRRALAALIFEDSQKRQLLNSIVHPLVRAEEERLLKQHQHAPLVVLMVPLLYEVGMENLADKVMVVVADDEVRFERLQARSGMSREEARNRLAAQMPQHEKAARADFVIDNSGALEATRKQVLDVLQQLGISATS